MVPMRRRIDPLPGVISYPYIQLNRKASLQATPIVYYVLTKLKSISLKLREIEYLS